MLRSLTLPGSGSVAPSLFTPPPSVLPPVAFAFWNEFWLTCLIAVVVMLALVSLPPLVSPNERPGALSSSVCRKSAPRLTQFRHAKSPTPPADYSLRLNSASTLRKRKRKRANASLSNACRRRGSLLPLSLARAAPVSRCNNKTRRSEPFALPRATLTLLLVRCTQLTDACRSLLLSLLLGQSKQAVPNFVLIDNTIY